MCLLKLPTILRMFSVVRGFPEDNIQNFPKGVVLELSWICDSDEKLEKHRKPKLLKTTFSTSCNLITQYNHLLHKLKPSLETIYLFYTVINKCLIFFHIIQ